MTVNKFETNYKTEWTKEDQKEFENNKITWSYNEDKQMEIWQGFIGDEVMNNFYPDYYIKDEKDIKEFVNLCNEWNFEDITINQYSHASDKKVTTFLEKFTFDEVFK